MRNSATSFLRRSGFARFLHWMAMRSLLVVLSALMVGLPIPLPRLTSRAQAQTAAASADSFTFGSSTSATAMEHSASTDAGNAMKPRTSPIGSSGAYTDSVTIRLPPGRSGMTPDLTLGYTSSGVRTASAVGAGWSLAVGSISRSTEQGFPVLERAGEQTRYAAQGPFAGPSGPLVITTSSEGLGLANSSSLLHVPKREASPVRYEFIANQDRWIEHLPSGDKRFYGAIGSRTARIVNELGTHEWLLLEERDPEGNSIEYDYHYLDDIVHGQRRGYIDADWWLSVQYRPVLKSVRWGGNVSGSVAHKFRVAVSVRDYLGDVDMMNGHVQSKGLVERIAVFGPDSATSSLETEYWKYDLTITASADTGRPLLRSVTESASGVSARTTTFSYSSNGNPFSVRPSQSTCSTTRTASFDSLRDLPSSDPEVYRSGGIPSTTTFPNAARALSAPGLANAYQFRDMDADGDSDIVYMPAGLQGPAAQWIMARSHQRGADGKFSRFGNSSALSIPEDLLITEFADVDGDADADAISFPLTPYEGGGSSFNYASEYRVPVVDVASWNGLAQGWSPAINPLNGFRMLLAPPSTATPLFMKGIRFCWIDPRSTLFSSTSCIPGLGLCTPRPDDDWNPFDPRWRDTTWTSCANGPWPWCRSSTVGTLVCNDIGGPGEDYRDPSGHGAQFILIGTNSARGTTSGVRVARIDAWPGLKKMVVSRERSTDGATPCTPGVPCNRFFGSVQDFQAPASDLNGDGKADILLLKGANSSLRAWGGAGSYFTPHAYLSDGQNFWSDWPSAPEASMSVDVTSLVSTTALQLGQINTFRTTVLPSLRTVVPGMRTLPAAWTTPMTAANRTALSQLLSSYSAQDAGDEARVRSLRSALVALFEADLWARVPRPVVPLKAVTDAWNAQIAVRALTRPALIGLAIPTVLVPAVDVDVSPILQAGGNGVAISMADLLDLLSRPRFLLRPPGQTILDLTSINRLVSAISGVLVTVFIGQGAAPSAPRVGSFTWSARQIFHDGRESSCVGAACNQNGDTSIYPAGADFTALPLDINSDGLPELVTASRPLRVPRMNAPGSSLFCPGGHQVHINRGYRWDTHEEWSAQGTVVEQWSTPPLLGTEYARSQAPSPLALIQNRAGRCTDSGFDGLDINQIDEYLQPSGQVVTTLPLSGANFSDVNADGRVDLVVASEVTRSQARTIEQRVFLNTGLGFRNGLGAAEANGSCVLPPDFVFSQYNADTRSTMPLAGRSRLADIDNDGLLDLVYSGICVDGGIARPCAAQAGLPTVAKWRRNLMKHPDLLTRVERPAGAWTAIDYVAATSDVARGTTVARSGSLPTGYQVVRELRSGAQPIINPWANVGGETTQRIAFKYDNYVREEGSTRAIGFEKVTATFANGNCTRTTTTVPITCTYVAQAESTSTYDVRPTIAGVTVPHPLRGALVKSRSVDLVRNAETETTQNYTVSPFGNAARVRATDSITATKEGGITLYTAAQEREPDEYGFFKKTITGRSDALGQIVESAPETTVTTRTFKHVGSAWRLGRPATEATYGDKFDEFGARSRALLAQSITEYGSDNRVSAHKVLLDGGPATGSDCWTGPQWSTTTFTNYELGQPKTINDNGSVLSLQYDAHKLYVALRSVNIPASASSPGALLEEDSSWDLRFGTVAYTNDANGRADTRMFDWQGRLVSHYGPGGDVLVNHRYDDRSGGPWTVTSDHYTTPTSFYSTWTAFDGYGRELASNKQVGGTSGSTNAANRVSRNRYDGLGRLVTSYQPVRLTALNTVALESTPLATTKAYDGFDRVLSETLPTAAGQPGRTIAYAYNNVSDGGVVYPQVTTTNLRKLKSERRFDANGSLISVRRYNADNTIAASYSYQSDGAGRMVSVSDSLGTRRVSFDEGGRLTHATLPRAANATAAPTRVHSYCYDTRSKLISASTPEGRQVELARDSVGRTAHVSVDYEHTRNGQTVAEATTADFYYDCSVASASLGRLCRQTDSASTTSIEYDNYGRANRYEVELAPAIADTLPDGVSNWYALQLNYGLGGQLRESVVEGLGAVSQRVLYGHDIVGRTNNISLPNLTRTLVSSAAYDPFERLTSATLGNGVVSSWDFDLPTGYLTAEKMAVGSSVFTELRYPLVDHDENGNIKREQRLSFTSSTQTLSEKTHTFNALDELATSRVLMNGAERRNERFTIAQGNLTSVVAGTATTTYLYEDQSNVQAVSRITAPGRTRTLSYDADGWVSQDVETVTTPATINEKSLTFDAGGCMREAVVRSGPQNAPQTTTTRNLCGFGGSRVFRETTKPNGQVERVYYLPDGSELRPEQNLFVMQIPVAKSTVTTLAYSLTDGSLVQSESGYIHTDVRGSVVARTPLNAANVRIPDREAEYDAWGETLAYNGVATPRYQYTNEEPDPGTGYYYFGARPYDPTLRRWLAPDPLIMSVFEGEASTGGNLNLYSYCANNPIRFIDQSGQVPLDTIWDAGNVIYDVGKMLVGAATGDMTLIVAGGKDLLMDGGALLVPYVPAGLNKVDDVVDLARAGDKALDAAKAGDKALDAVKAGDKAVDTAKAGDKVAHTTKAGETGKTYQTYTKENPATGEVYTGRTSGTGTPAQNVARRDAGHHMNDKGFGPAKLDKSSKDPKAIRGREEQSIQANGGAKRRGGTSGNEIGGISPRNPRRQEYLDAADKAFKKKDQN